MILLLQRLFLITFLFLDASELSYNRKSRLLNRNHSVLEDVKFTRNSDYCDGSNKRKSKEQETKMNLKSKKNKNCKSTEKNVQTINHTGSTINSSRNSDNGIEKIMIRLPINVFNAMNINRITEESIVNKCLNESINNSTVFNNTLNNDNLLSEKLDSVNDKAYSNVDTTEQFPLIKFEKPHDLSLTSSNPSVNSKNQPSHVVSVSQIKKKKDIKSSQNLVQPILEPKQVMEEKHEMYGMF